jgi:8-oxo-dGTP pyrophosphatase MutT (NUDIX family)
MAEETKGSAAPAEPRPAATVILMRRGGKHSDRGLEVCMLRRSPEMRFMPGVWVFPGGAVDVADGEGEAGIRVCAVRELAEEASIELEPEDLIPYSRWITPVEVPVRFDTYFYLALAPSHSAPEPDGTETLEAGWFNPAQALERHASEELPLVFPTVKHLESLVGFANADEAIAAAASRSIEPVLPSVVGEGSERRIVLPGDWDDVAIPEKQLEAEG